MRSNLGTTSCVCLMLLDEFRFVSLTSNSDSSYTLHRIWAERPQALASLLQRSPLQISGRAHCRRCNVRISKKTTVLSSLGAIGAGAALMFFFDPHRGARRRAFVSHTASRAAREVSHSFSDAAHEITRFTNGNWRGVRHGSAPSTRVLLASLGGALALLGTRRRGPSAKVLETAGMALLGGELADPLARRA